MKINLQMLMHNHEGEAVITANEVPSIVQSIGPEDYKVKLVVGLNSRGNFVSPNLIQELDRDHSDIERAFLEAFVKWQSRSGWGFSSFYENNNNIRAVARENRRSPILAQGLLIGGVLAAVEEKNLKYIFNAPRAHVLKRRFEQTDVDSVYSPGLVELYRNIENSLQALDRTINNPGIPYNACDVDALLQSESYRTNSIVTRSSDAPRDPSGKAKALRYSSEGYLTF